MENYNATTKEANKRRTDRKHFAELKSIRSKTKQIHIQNEYLEVLIKIGMIATAIHACIVISSTF